MRPGRAANCASQPASKKDAAAGGIVNHRTQPSLEQGRKRRWERGGAAAPTERLGASPRTPTARVLQLFSSRGDRVHQSAPRARIPTRIGGGREEQVAEGLTWGQSGAMSFL